jgi:hypothetical protein
MATIWSGLKIERFVLGGTAHSPDLEHPRALMSS